MGNTSFSARYGAGMAACGGRCPIEAGVLGRLAEHECRHGRLHFDRAPACGCSAAGRRRRLTLPRRGEERTNKHAA